MTTDLVHQLKVNEALWQRWMEFGITPGAHFEIEFYFNTTNKEAADKLVDGFEKEGLAVQKRARRLFLLTKNWQVLVPISQSWTLDTLNDRTRQFCRLADMLHVVFDGCGALMPSQERKT